MLSQDPRPGRPAPAPEALRSVTAGEGKNRISKIVRSEKGAFHRALCTEQPPRAAVPNPSLGCLTTRTSQGADCWDWDSDLGPVSHFCLVNRQ